MTDDDQSVEPEVHLYKDISKGSKVHRTVKGTPRGLRRPVSSDV